MGKKMKGNSIGISLILVVFILLCLITFGTLSFMLSNADNEMSISTADNVIEYYTADMLAQEKLFEIDEILEAVYSGVDNEAEYWSVLEESFLNGEELEVNEESCYLTFYTEVSDVETLVSTLEILYPVETGYYRIESWLLLNNTNL